MPMKHSWVMQNPCLFVHFNVLLLRICCGLQYEPELFPGLIYRMKQPKIVLLIFVSGKIVLTGAKVYFFPHHILFICSEFHYFVGGICLRVCDHWVQFVYCTDILCHWCAIGHIGLCVLFQVRDEIYEAFENIYPVLTEFRKVQQW